MNAHPANPTIFVQNRRGADGLVVSVAGPADVKCVNIEAGEHGGWRFMSSTDARLIFALNTINELKTKFCNVSALEPSIQNAIERGSPDGVEIRQNSGDWGLLNKALYFSDLMRKVMRWVAGLVDADEPVVTIRVSTGSMSAPLYMGLLRSPVDSKFVLALSDWPPGYLFHGVKFAGASREKALDAMMWAASQVKAEAAQ
jgi:hypothetical protein